MNRILQKMSNNSRSRSAMIGEKKKEDYVPPADLEIASDIPVPSEATSGLAADLYRPRSYDGQNIPILIFLHGGGLVAGDRSFNRPFCEIMARAGFLVFNLDYRLIDRADAFAEISDVIAGFRLVKAVAEEYGGDPDRVFVVGESAGGFLAEYAVAIERSGHLQKMYGISPSGLRISGIVFLSAMFYTTRPDVIGWIYSKDLYKNRLKDKTFKKLTNPENPEIMDYLPPVLLISSKGDFLRRYTLRYAGALRKAGHPYKLIYHRKARHLKHAFVSIRPLLPESRKTQQIIIKWIQDIRDNE